MDSRCVLLEDLEQPHQSERVVSHAIMANFGVANCRRK